MDRAQTDRLLADLEDRIRRRRRWRGKRVFYQVLEAEVAPIEQTSADPEYVRQRVREMLTRHGHQPEPPPMPLPLGDFAAISRGVRPPG